MKIERISENVIKVTISLSDLEERNIDLDALNYNSPAAQELFWDMMEQAELQLGFDIYDSQLLIEPVTDEDDGFVVTITKVDEDGDFESIQKYIKSKFKKTDVKLKKKSRRLLSTLLVYSFRSLDDMAVACRKIQNIYSGESSAYKLKTMYYLIFSKTNYNIDDLRKLELSLSEFGKKLSNASFYEGYLNEYGEKICENNAVDILASYC